MHRRFVVEGEGQVSLVVEQGGLAREEVVLGYVTGNLNSPPVVVEVDEATIEVREKR